MNFNFCVIYPPSAALKFITLSELEGCPINLSGYANSPRSGDLIVILLFSYLARSGLKII